MKRLYSVVALALFISLFIYLFYRSEKTVVNQFVALLLSKETFALIRSSIHQELPLNLSIVFSLPGGLWVFCTTVLARDLYFNIRHHHVPLVDMPICFAIALELCQLAHLTNGTFDVLDIAFFIAFWLIARYSVRPSSQKNILAPFTLNSFACMACFVAVYLAHVTQ